MTKFNTTAITKAINAALLHGDAFEAEMLKLHKLLKGADRETAKAIICPRVSAYYIVKTPEAESGFVDGKWVDSGCAAKRNANRILLSIMGTAPKTSSKVVVDKKLVESLRDTIVGAGLTKKQFDAVLSALRASVSFK